MTAVLSYAFEEGVRLSIAKSQEPNQIGLGAAFTQLTGEVLQDVVELSRKTFDIDAARLVLHYSIIYANEVGQPRAQELQLGDSVQGNPGVSGQNCSQSKQDNTVSVSTDQPVKKLKMDNTTCLVRRIEQLEQEKLDNVDFLEKK